MAKNNSTISKRQDLLNAANDSSLPFHKRQESFDRIFSETFTLPKNNHDQFYFLAEDFSETDLAFLKILSEKDYMKELCYPDWVTTNPFHSIGIPAGLKARRRWLEFDQGGILTSRFAVKVKGKNVNWTLWRHLLSIVDKDGDAIPKEQQAFIEKHCGPFALLEILCDDIGLNRYDLRMIQTARDFAITKATSLAKKPTPEMLEWVKQKLAAISILDDTELASWQTTCNAAYLLAPLVKKLKKGTYLDESYIRLITLNGHNEKLNSFVHTAINDEHKAIALKQILAKPIHAGQQFFDPAYGFAKILKEFTFLFEYQKEEEWFFKNKYCALELARFCQAAHAADKSAYRYFFFLSGVPQFLVRFSNINTENKKLLEPFQNTIDDGKEIEKPEFGVYYYQAWRSEHLNRETIQKSDFIVQQQLNIFATKLLGFKSIDAMMSQWETLEQRRLCFRMEVGLLSGATFYDLIITNQDGWRKECAVFRKGSTEWLPISLANEKFLALVESPEVAEIAAACEEGLTNMSNEEAYCTLSWNKYWADFEKK